MRMRGAFTQTSAGCRVDYRIEFIPWLLWALIASYAIGTPLLVGLVLFGSAPPSVLAWAVVITSAGLGINLFFSERQAHWLKDYVASVLDVK